MRTAPLPQSGVTPTHGESYVLYNVLGNLFEVPSKYVPPVHPVGSVTYGIVWLDRGCATNSDTKEEVAIKKIGNAFDNRIDAKRTLREIKLICHMDHDNVIQIKAIIRPPSREHWNDIYIVYELIYSSQMLSDDRCQYFLYQLLRALKYVHSANALHRDLKPCNLLLTANCDLKIYLHSYVCEAASQCGGTTLLPEGSSLALDLAEKMLVFDPCIEDALNHPYSLSLNEINDPACLSWSLSSISNMQP